MGFREFTKSGAFVAIVFALVVVLLPFGLQQIGEATGLFQFSVTKIVKGWFSPAAGARTQRDSTLTPVDWDRYRRDLEEFAQWAECRDCAFISLPPQEVEVIQVDENDEKPERRLWLVPVASCTAGGANGRKRGYVFISGLDNPFEEGAMIAPSDELCGYEIVSVGERAVWLRAVFEDDGDVPMGIVGFKKFDFTRIDGDCLVRGNNKYVARDAFSLSSGGWLMVDSFMPPDGVVFKILDERRRDVATILCIVIGEKGGRR